MSVQDTLQILENIPDDDPVAVGYLLIEHIKYAGGDRADLFVGRGGDVNVRDDEGLTPLHHAAARGARHAIRALVKSGRCDYLIRDNKGRYAFELAIEWARDHAVARLLMTKQAQQAARLGLPAYIPRT